MVPLGDTGFAGYGWKQASLAAQTFMLAASAHGLDTCPMEGLDERWVRRAVGLPRHYSVPLIIPVGCAMEPVKLSPRFPPETVFHREQFGTAYKGIVPV
jgi:nitroreductase